MRTPTMTQQQTIPSYEQCRSALARIEAAQRDIDGRGTVTNPYVLANAWLDEAKVYLSRLAAYEEMGSTPPAGYRNEVRHCLDLAVLTMGQDNGAR